MRKKNLIITVSFLLCSFFAMGQEVINTEFTDEGAYNTESEITKQDLKISAYTTTDQASIQAIKNVFKERNKALVSISDDLKRQKKEMELLIDKMAAITAKQGSSYSSLSPSAQVKYLVRKALIQQKFDKIKVVIAPYFETDNYMTEGERILYTLKAIRNAAELVDIE